MDGIGFKQILVTAAIGFSLSIASCGYRDVTDRIGKLEAQAPKAEADVVTLQSNAAHANQTLIRLESKIDWIIDHMIRQPAARRAPR